MKVKDCMCHDVCFVKPETKVSEVAKLMAKNHIEVVFLYVIIIILFVEF